MSADIHWGMPVILYLFLAGMGAGAYTVSSSVLLRGGGGQGGTYHFNLARYGAFLAPIPVMIGTGFLILELGSFEVGNYFRFLNLFTTLNQSPMSIGSWLLMAFIGASVLYAYTFYKGSGNDDSQATLRRTLAWIGVPLGIAVGMYTGVLLGATPARPFWNTPVLALLFTVSSLSTGVAGILLLRAIFGDKSADEQAEEDAGYLLSASDTLLIGLELLIIAMFLLFSFLTAGNAREAVLVILSGGEMATMFWFGVVVIGLLLPAVVELKFVLPRLLYQRRYKASRGAEIAVSLVVLFGGFVLRYVVVIAGQITGPVGI